MAQQPQQGRSQDYCGRGDMGVLDVKKLLSKFWFRFYSVFISRQTSKICA